MKPFLLSNAILATWLALFLNVTPASAQATRTWVSSIGLDSNPCSRTSPCKTLAGAYSQTLAGGEISVVDAGAYGALTITHAITINGEGTLASVLVSSGTGITVSAGSSDQVIIRNLAITGAGGGGVGISLTSGNLTVDSCFIYGFTSGFFGGSGINAVTTSNATLTVRNTNITNSTFGVLGTASSGFLAIGLDEVHINNAGGYGVAALSNSVFFEINRSSIRNAGAAAVITSSGNGVISVDNSEITNNGVAFNASSSGSVIRINGNSVYDNTTGFLITSGATIATANNNKTAGNGGATVPNGTLGNQ